MADDAPRAREVLGSSPIFTPEVINDIHMKAELGRYRMRGFSMFKKLPGWDDLIFLPGTLTRFVIEGYREKCDTKTVLGARFAKKPLELDIPVYITGMSFGALSLEAKMALAKGASMAGTATCSGEGGMIPPERDLSTKWYYQVIQSRYGFNPHHLMLADGVEFFIGQGCKVGLGGHLMGQKVTEQVAEMRSLPAGIDQRSPARHPDWLGPDDLSLKVQETREATNYEVPIQLKLGAARVYDDVRMAAKCGPDVIYLDGAEGGTGAGPHIAAEETGIPLLAAIPEARRALEDVGLADEVDLVVAGGIRNGGDVAKCLALGADAIAIGHSALMALNCNKEIPGVTDYEGTVGVPAGQCYHCHTGRCPVGITTQDPELRKRLHVDEAAQRVFNFLHTLTLEVQMLARACGKTSVHNLEPEDLAALTIEASAMARVPLAGTDYIPGVTEGRALEEIRTLLDQYLENPVDYMPQAPTGRVRSDGRAREGRLDRRRVPLRRALSLPGGHLAGRGHRPRCGDPGRGPELARGRRAAGRGGDAGGVRPLLQLVPADLLPDPRGPRGRDRAQGADRPPAVGELLRHPAQGGARQVRPAGARTVGRGLGDGRRGLEAVGAGGLGAPRALRAATMPELPASIRHLVIGAGVHGLSTAWHLASAGEEVLCVDKAGVGAGASGIACGVIRNNYFQPAMQELMAACVEIWESDPETLHYHPSGYVALGPPSQEPDLVEVFERQQAIGYRSELHTGEAAVRDQMRGLYPDWRAEGLSVCLHEHAGGFAFNRESMLGLAEKARARGGADRRGGRGDRLRRGRLGRRDRRRDERGPDRGRAGRGGGRAVDPAPVGDARVARADRRSLCGRLGGTRGADVDLLVPAGGGGRAGAVDAGHRARRRGARPARRLRSPACGR